MELRLYNYFRSSAAYRVRIALHLKGLEFEYVPIHLLNNGGEQNSPEFRKINPAREVPALMHEGQILSQSVAIIEYLDEMFSAPSLYPREPHRRARVRQLCELINCTHPLQNLKVQQYLEKEWGATADQKTKWTQEWMGRGFESFEETIRSTAGRYCVGDTVTAADLFLIPQVFAANRFQVDISKYKTIQKINEACLSLSAFQKAHPYCQIDTPEEFRGKAEFPKTSP